MHMPHDKRKADIVIVNVLAIISEILPVAKYSRNLVYIYIYIDRSTISSSSTTISPSSPTALNGSALRHFKRSKKIIKK